MDGKRTGESEQAHIVRLNDEIERLREDKADLLNALTGLYEVCRWEKVAPEINAAKSAIAKATGDE
jgi:hypothetical protein